jgi:D-serine deaminase-like pyridoxal phosphate-dependent protein
MPSGVIRRRACHVDDFSSRRAGHKVMRVAATVSGHPKDQTKRCVLLGAGRRVKASDAVKNRY